MKALIVWLVIGFACVSRAGIIEGISQVETGDNDFAVGTHGELSRWQLMPDVRKSYTSVDWQSYTQARIAVAVELGLRLKRFEARYGHPATPLQTALLWRCPTRVAHPTISDLDYAQRVVALSR